MSKRIIGFLVICGLIGIFIYTLLQSSNTGLDPATYTAQIETDRRDKDSSFKAAEDSPLLPDDKANFKGLAYYPVKPALRIIARLDRLPEPEYIQIEKTTGENENYLRWGWAYFQLQGKEQQLLILQPTTGDTDYLFIPFADETSARETYGAGRYLEVPEPEGNKIVLDFNKAYNPYCAYNEKYSCPLPPRENLLQIAIEAGEKTYEK